MSRDHRPLLWATVAVGLCLLLGWAAWMSWTLLDQTEQNGRTARRAASAAHRIQDCTTPGQRCYELSQRRMANAVNGINEGTLRVVTSTLLCFAVDGKRTEAELLDCVELRLGQAAVRR